MTREQDSPRGTLTLAKGLSLLSMFELNHPEWTFTELWKRTGIPRTTAIRLLDTLEESGYVQFDSATGKYYLGPAMFRGAYLMLSPLQLGRVARPYLEQLQEETKETVGFAVLVHGQPVVVEIVHTSRPYKMDVPGLPLLDISSCYQRVFLAYSSNEQRAKAFEHGITPRTAYTRTDPREITQVLDRIKDEGVAVSENEVVVGSGSVSRSSLYGEWSDLRHGRRSRADRALRPS